MKKHPAFSTLKGKTWFCCFGEMLLQNRKKLRGKDKGKQKANRAGEKAAPFEKKKYYIFRRSVKEKISLRRTRKNGHLGMHGGIKRQKLGKTKGFCPDFV